MGRSIKIQKVEFHKLDNCLNEFNESSYKIHHIVPHLMHTLEDGTQRVDEYWVIFETG